MYIEICIYLCHCLLAAAFSIMHWSLEYNGLNSVTNDGHLHHVDIFALAYLSDTEKWICIIRIEFKICVCTGAFAPTSLIFHCATNFQRCFNYNYTIMFSYQLKGMAIFN